MACREAVTEKIHGLCRKPQHREDKGEFHVEREHHTQLHSPPFWWNKRPGPKWPWQCWSLDDYSSKSCKWVGCYRPCPCRQKEEEMAMSCRFPGHCGFHMYFHKHTQNCFKSKERSEAKKLCCFCKLVSPETNPKTDDDTLPDPRCLGQYHSSLLENILGRGTTLSIAKDKCHSGKSACSIRGYIPGDVHRGKGWSGCVGGDPMHEELNNSFFPFENPSTRSKLSNLSVNEKTVYPRPCYEHPFQDHRFQYGMHPEQLLDEYYK